MKTKRQIEAEIAGALFIDAGMIKVKKIARLHHSSYQVFLKTGYATRGRYLFTVPLTSAMPMERAEP